MKFVSFFGNSCPCLYVIAGEIKFIYLFMCVACSINAENAENAENNLKINILIFIIVIFIIIFMFAMLGNLYLVD